ncbi:hypothetical protein GCM10009092_09410 [Bowmanella denitrificans]|uniref:Big-1 domain-containing protein n=1 Tax=Bowmanella denitrificans TaxID=366582 RepID=A0ABP3GJ71_9ALTE
MKSTFKVVAVYLLSLLLVACGGGGSLSTDGGGNPTTPVEEVTIGFTVVDAQGNEVNPSNSTLSAATPWRIRAKTQVNGANAANKLVTFVMPADGYATFDPASGTATSNSDGIAEIGIKAGEVAGGFSVVARSGESDDFTLNLTSAGDGNQTSVDIAKLSLFAKGQNTILPSSGADGIELIALVQNSSNAVVEDVDVRFSASSGQLASSLVTSDAEGLANNVLSTRNEPENRDITVTATAGNQTAQLTIRVVGTTVKINGPASVIINDEAEFAITVADSDGNGLVERAVQLTSQSGEFPDLSSDTVLTGANGQILVKYRATSAGQDAITARALNAQASFTVTIQQDDFSFQGLPASTTKQIPINTSSSISVRWFKNGVAYSGGTVAFNTSRGEFVSSHTATTNASGIAAVNIRSSNAGLAAISAEGTDANGNIVTARAQVEFVATQADRIIVDATPDTVGPNGQTATITALVLDPDGNLVKNKQVEFTVDDTSAGSISAPTAITDNRGVATVVFTSNAVTGAESVNIKAVVADNRSVESSTLLTVANRPFDITLGSGNVVVVPEDNTTYIKEFAVFVTGSDGAPIANEDLRAVLEPLPYSQGGYYRKGTWQWDSIREVWVPVVTATCVSEDVNDNGLLDQSATVDEDTNGDTFLTPGIVGSLRFKDSDSITDENGRVTLQYEYPKDRAPWTSVIIKVLGRSERTEDAEGQVYILDYAGADAADEKSSPPNSWYGTGANCTDVL